MIMIFLERNCRQNLLLSKGRKKDGQAQWSAKGSPSYSLDLFIISEMKKFTPRLFKQVRLFYFGEKVKE